MIGLTCTICEPGVDSLAAIIQRACGRHGSSRNHSSCWPIPAHHLGYPLLSIRCRVGRVAVQKTVSILYVRRVLTGDASVRRSLVRRLWPIVRGMSRHNASDRVVPWISNFEPSGGCDVRMSGFKPSQVVTLAMSSRTGRFDSQQSQTGRRCREGDKTVDGMAKESALIELQRLGLDLNRRPSAEVGRQA